MKNTLIITLISFATMLFVACDKDEVEPINPSGITDVKAFQLPGEIGLTWKRTEPVTFEYINIRYFDHLTKKDVSILASQYTDTVIIENTRAKYGEYTFTFQPFSSTQTAGKETVLKAKSGAYEPEVTVASQGTEVKLTADMLSSESQEPSEGPIKNLVDGDPNTFFHTAWSTNKPSPHNFEINLGKTKMRGFSFFCQNRATHNNGGFKVLTIQGSNDGTTWTDITTISEGFPTAKGAQYTSQPILADKEYSMFKFVATERASGQAWFHLAEFKLFKHGVTIFDPENSKEDI